jgi:heat shock protein HslJ
MSSLYSPPGRFALSPGLPTRARGWLLGSMLLGALAGGCGGQSLSTDTGNPPVVGQKLRLTATSTGVLVTGEPGAVPAGARVDVVNAATAETASTTAAEDGSFEVELAGAATDEYRVYVGSGQQSWRTRLTSSGTTTPEMGIDGRAFLLQSAEGYTPLQGTRLRLSFNDSQLSFSAGCNSYSGPYSLCDGKLCVSQLGGTEIGCDTERHTQDEWFASFFEGSPQLDIAGAALTLESASATLELLDREVADPDRPLAGRVWSIDTFIQGGAASSSPATTLPTVEFRINGTLGVFTTCNTGDASYTRSGQVLTLSSVVYTDAGCPDSRRSVEQSVQSVLAEGEITFEISANRLTLMRGSSGLGATTD